MMDNYRLDSHKMMYHPKQICDWMNGVNVPPIYIEISPCNHCNNRCIFCSFSFTNYNYNLLDRNILVKNIIDMGDFGVRAIMFGGEGEPLLHPDLPEIIKITKTKGIDVAITTNGYFMNEEFCNKSLEYINWIKVSVDAGNGVDYARIHGTNKEDFSIILKNIKTAVEIKRKRRLDCTVGVQALLMDNNFESVIELGEKLSDINVDYFVIKPYTSHPYRKQKDFEFTGEVSRNMFPLNLNVIIRKHTFNDLNEPRNYHRCYALDFWSYIDSFGDVYSCSNFLGNQDYVYGNMYKNIFSDIWMNRKKIYPKIEDCRMICRMDKVNRYLQELKHPNKDVNFI